MKIKIQFEIELPDIPHKYQDVDEYIRYQFRDKDNLDINIFEEHITNTKDLPVDLHPIPGTFQWNPKI